MISLVKVLALTVALGQSPDISPSAVAQPGPCTGYLSQPCSPDQVEPYIPQAGDLIFFDDLKLTWRILDFLACTRPPDHNGIVVTMPDGSLGSLESAPDGSHLVELQDLLPRLRSYKGTVYVRRIKCPLAPEQSEALTCFSLRQVGKGYAYVRLVLQITPFRARGPVRSQFLGHTFMNRRRWYCSELVIAAGVAAGLFDPHEMRANTIYPRDLFDDTSFDLNCQWEPVQRWSCDGR